MSTLETAARFFIEVSIASNAAGAPTPCITVPNAPDRCMIYTETSKPFPTAECVALARKETAFWKAFLEGKHGNVEADLKQTRTWIKCENAQ